MTEEQKIAKRFAMDCLASIKTGEGLCFREDNHIFDEMPILLSFLEEIESVVTEWCKSGIKAAMHDWGINDRWEDEE